MELSDEDIQTWRCFIKKQFDNHEKVDALCDAALAHNAAKRQEPVATVRITEVFDDKQFPAGFSADDWQKLSALKDGTKLFTSPPTLAEARELLESAWPHLSNAYDDSAIIKNKINDFLERTK